MKKAARVKQIILGVIFLILSVFSGIALAEDDHPGYANGIPVLSYHLVNDLQNDLAVPPAEFDRQMKMLQEAGFQTILPDRLIAYLKEEKVILPEKPILITFDDGYRDNYTNAFPILKKHGFQGTILMIANEIDDNGYLTTNQIKEMAQEGFLIGGHTMTHPDLTKLTAGELSREIYGGKKKVEKASGKDAKVFAYPYGFFNLASFQEVQDAGYQGAFSLLTGLNNPKIDNVYLMRRIPVFRYTDFDKLFLALKANKPKESLLDYAD